MNEERKDYMKTLREKAEVLIGQIADTRPEVSQGEIRQIIHELSVHQIELELQNEALRDARSDLEQARDRFAWLYNNAPVGYLTLNAGGIIRQTNRTFADLVGEDMADIPGRPLTDWMDEAGRDIFLGRYRAFFKSPEGKQIDIWLKNLHGGGFTGRLAGRPDPDHLSLSRTSETGSLLLVSVSDISEQKRSEEREQHVKQVLLAIRRVNQLIAREKDRIRLIQKACASLIATSGCFSAWIVLLDEERKVTATASAGLDDGISLLKEEMEQGRFPVCMKKSLPSDEIVITQHPDADAGCLSGTRDGGRAGMTIRLECADRVYGVLSVSVPERFVRDEEEHALFAALADDLGFALYKIALEEALQESEARWQFALEGVGDGVWDWNIETGRVFFSRQWKAILGFSEEEIGDTVDEWERRIHPEDRERCYRDVERHLKGETSMYENEHRLRCRDGSYKWILDRGKVIQRDREGNALRMIGTHKDISDRRRTQELIRRAKEEWERTFDAVPDMIAILDENHRILRINRSMADKLGKQPPELIGKVCYEAMHKSDAPPAFCPHMQTIRDHSSCTAEISEQYLGGHFLVTTTPLFNKSGDFVGAVHIARDITAQKQAEEALRESEAHFRAAFRISPDSININRLEDGVYVDINQGFTEICGYTREDAIGKSSLELNIWKNPEDRKALVAGLKNNGYVGNLEAEFRTKNGDIRIGLMSARMLSMKGEPHILSITRDITERKINEEERRSLERQVQQTQKLESLGVLAGGVAHDFNNILMAVMGHAELALDELSPMSPARARIREIETAARRAAELCRQMLAYTGKATFALEKTDLRELIAEMAHLLKTTISKKAILNLNLDQGLPPIQADPSQIRQVVMNLIINASDAIGERSGVITIAAGATRCDEEYLQKTEWHNEELAPGLYVHLEVTDTGCGMEPEIQERIFEPFFSTKFTGRGLGLAAVMGIVRAHRGALKVYSEPDRGTTFKILFPALETAENSISGDVPDAMAPWRGSGLILLADDEESLRALGATMLERLGFTVLTAADGREAVNRYQERQEEIDLVIMDLTMPHMDGAEAFGELRRIDPDVRVLLASGYSEEDVAARFAGKSVAGVLQKPYTLRKLREILAGLMPRCRRNEQDGS